MFRRYLGYFFLSVITFTPDGFAKQKPSAPTPVPQQLLKDILPYCESNLPLPKNLKQKLSKSVGSKRAEDFDRLINYRKKVETSLLETTLKSALSVNRELKQTDSPACFNVDGAKIISPVNSYAVQSTDDAARSLNLFDPLSDKKTLTLFIANLRLNNSHEISFIGSRHYNLKENEKRKTSHAAIKREIERFQPDVLILEGCPYSKKTSPCDIILPTLFNYQEPNHREYNLENEESIWTAIENNIPIICGEGSLNTLQEYIKNPESRNQLTYPFSQFKEEDLSFIKKLTDFSFRMQDYATQLGVKNFTVVDYLNLKNQLGSSDEEINDLRSKIADLDKLFKSFENRSLFQVNLASFHEEYFSKPPSVNNPTKRNLNNLYAFYNDLRDLFLKSLIADTSSKNPKTQILYGAHHLLTHLPFLRAQSSLGSLATFPQCHDPNVRVYYKIKKPDFDTFKQSPSLPNKTKQSSSSR